MHRWHVGSICTQKSQVQAHLAQLLKRVGPEASAPGAEPPAKCRSNRLSSARILLLTGRQTAWCFPGPNQLLNYPLITVEGLQQRQGLQCSSRWDRPRCLGVP